jgi:hypothetical protein
MLNSSNKWRERNEKDFNDASDAHILDEIEYINHMDACSDDVKSNRMLWHN